MPADIAPWRYGPPCGRCEHLDRKEINPGVAYCHRFMMWRGAAERLHCPGFKVRDDG